LKKHREYFDKLAQCVGIQKQEDWYTTAFEFTKKEHNLLRTYNSCFISALKTIYPEYEWNAMHLNSLPRHYWESLDNQRHTMNFIGNQLGIQKQEDWYSVNAHQVKPYGILRHYNGSLVHALTSIYPQFDWKPWRFNSVPQKYWKNRQNQRNFFDWIAEQIGINTQHDWYNVRKGDIFHLGVVGILDVYGSSFFVALQNIYPEYDWNPLLAKNPPVNFTDHITAEHLREYLNGFVDPHLLQTLRSFERQKQFKGGLFHSTFSRIKWTQQLLRTQKKRHKVKDKNICTLEPNDAQGDMSQCIQVKLTLLLTIN
jgi:hypothetical protein